MPITDTPVPAGTIYPRAICQHCGIKVPLTRSGTLRLHRLRRPYRSQITGPMPYCAGSHTNHYVVTQP